MFPQVSSRKLQGAKLGFPHAHTDTHAPKTAAEHTCRMSIQPEAGFFPSTETAWLPHAMQPSPHTLQALTGASPSAWVGVIVHIILSQPHEMRIRGAYVTKKGSVSYPEHLGELHLASSCHSALSQTSFHWPHSPLRGRYASSSFRGDWGSEDSPFQELGWRQNQVSDPLPPDAAWALLPGKNLAPSLLVHMALVLSPTWPQSLLEVCRLQNTGTVVS